MQPKLYFGHPVNTYGTELEEKLLGAIAVAFVGWEIENPNQPKHEEGYQRFKKENGNGMLYFTEKVLPLCKSGIFLPFRDGKWGAGVYKEAKYFADWNFPVWMINPLGIIEYTYLQEIHPLSVEETRERVRAADGAIIPY